MITQNALREKELQVNKRNLVRQEIVCKDGTKKAVFHKKRFNQPQYLDAKVFWDAQNKEPKENSKRQQGLREEAERKKEEVLITA